MFLLITHSLIFGRISLFVRKVASTTSSLTRLSFSLTNIIKNIITTRKLVLKSTWKFYLRLGQSFVPPTSNRRSRNRATCRLRVTRAWIISILFINIIIYYFLSIGFLYEITSRLLIIIITNYYSVCLLNNLVFSPCHPLRLFDWHLKYKKPW